MIQEIRTYDPKKHKIVKAGFVENNVFFKHIEPQHLIRIIGGYGIQDKVVNDLIEMGIKSIVFILGDRHLQISMESFLKNSTEIDLGHGVQKAINIKWLSDLSKEQLKLF